MRYLGLTEADRHEMLETIGAPGIDALFKDVPAGALNPRLDLPPHQASWKWSGLSRPWRRRMSRRWTCHSSSVPAPIATISRRRWIT